MDFFHISTENLSTSSPQSVDRNEKTFNWNLKWFFQGFNELCWQSLEEQNPSKEDRILLIQLIDRINQSFHKGKTTNHDIIKAGNLGENFGRKFLGVGNSIPFPIVLWLQKNWF